MPEQNYLADRLRGLFFLLTGVVIFFPTFSHAEERVALDFKDYAAGDPLPSAVGDAHLMELHSPRIEFLTPESSPPSPFPEGAHGLFVEQQDDNQARVRIRIKPFYASAAPKVGWIELELVVNSLTHNGVELGSGGISGVPSSENPVYEGKVILGLNLNAESPVDAVTFPTDSRKVMQQGIPSPEIGVPFRLRIAWDFSGGEPTMQLFINGEVLREPSGGELLLAIPNGEVQDGVDYLSLMLRNAILGRIFVSE